MTNNLIHCCHIPDGYCSECLQKQYLKDKKLVDDLHTLCQRSFNRGWSEGKNYLHEQTWNPTSSHPHLDMVKKWEDSDIKKEAEETVVKFYKRS